MAKKSFHNKPLIQATECKRCGTCCRKGGPSFHQEDKALVEKGTILSKYLYTIRRGEPAHDNIKGGLSPSATDIIKIKSRNPSSTCIFFNKKKNACTLYESRPLECRSLKCWDTREIERIYNQKRLTRKDLLYGIEGLWDLIEDHQKRCSYEKISRYVEAARNGDAGGVREEIMEMVQYDSHLRSAVVEKGGVDSEMTEFLFGRPLNDTIRMFGLKLKRVGNDL